MLENCILYLSVFLLSFLDYYTYYKRYDSNSIDEETTLPGNRRICGNRTVSWTTAFKTAVDGLLGDLRIATPKIKGFFAASTRQIAGGVGAVYAVAQCIETLNKTGCLHCLTMAYSSLRTCPPQADGRAIDVGCFFRYSDTAFFAENQTTDITPFLRSGNISFQPSSKILSLLSLLCILY